MLNDLITVPLPITSRPSYEQKERSRVVEEVRPKGYEFAPAVVISVSTQALSGMDEDEDVPLPLASVTRTLKIANDGPGPYVLKEVGTRRRFGLTHS